MVIAVRSQSPRRGGRNRLWTPSWSSHRRMLVSIPSSGRPQSADELEKKIEEFRASLNPLVGEAAIGCNEAGDKHTIFLVSQSPRRGGRNRLCRQTEGDQEEGESQSPRRGGRNRLPLSPAAATPRSCTSQSPRRGGRNRLLAATDAATRYAESQSPRRGGRNRLTTGLGNCCGGPSVSIPSSGRPQSAAATTATPTTSSRCLNPLVGEAAIG